MYSLKILTAESKHPTYRIYDAAGTEVATATTPDDACSVLQGLELLAQLKTVSPAKKK